MSNDVDEPGLMTNEEEDDAGELGELGLLEKLSRRASPGPGLSFGNDSRFFGVHDSVSIPEKLWVLLMRADVRSLSPDSKLLVDRMRGGNPCLSKPVGSDWIRGKDILRFRRCHFCLSVGWSSRKVSRISGSCMASSYLFYSQRALVMAGCRNANFG